MSVVQKYALALHTSSPELGLAISNFTDDRRCQTWDLGRELSSLIHQYLVEFIQPQTWTDLAFIAVAKGPGSFTGTRIGMVIARTLAQQLQIPLFAISTLAAVAWSRRSTLENPTSIAVQMTAARGQIFTGIYEINSSSNTCIELQPDTVMQPDTWHQTLNHWPTAHQLISAEGNLGYTAINLLELAALDWAQGHQPHWSTALPFYGQHPIEDKTTS